MANITRYNPFNEAVSLREAMDRLFADSFISPTGASPSGVAANLYETAEGFTLQLAMPGVQPADVEITVQQDTVNLKWEYKADIPKDAKVHWNGYQSGKYQQSFTLPAPINSEGVEAHSADGILTLQLPKVEQARARTIQVTAG